MKEYRFSEEGAKKTIQSRTISRIPLILIAVLGGLFLANYRTKGMLFGHSLVLILFLLIVGMAMAVGLLLGFKTGTKALMQTIYRISDTGIEKITPSGKSVKIDFDKIDFYKSTKRGLLIKGQTQKILIPSGVDGYDKILNLIPNKTK